MPRVFICSSLDALNVHYKEQLARELQAKGIEIVSTLAHCQWAIFIQTPEAIRSSYVQMLLTTALQLHQQRRLQGVLRFIHTPIQQLPDAWVALPSFDATRSIENVFERVSQAAKSTPNRKSFTSTFEFPGGDPEAARSSVQALLGPLSPATRSLPRQSLETNLSSSQTAAGYTSPLPTGGDHRSINKVPYWPHTFPSWVSSMKMPLSRTSALWITGGMVVVIFLLLSSLFSSSLNTLLKHSSMPVRQEVGQAYFTSSEVADPGNIRGINDGIQFDLTHLRMPAPHKRYYAWLLPDRSVKEGTAIALGVVTVNNGTSNLSYIDPSHMNLLAATSRLLITEEDDNAVPVVPSSNPKDWRYYAEIPQQPGKGDMMMSGSYLDHLRHLLVAEPHLEQLSLHGGLAVWLLRNTRNALEWANAASQAGDAPVKHRYLLRVLDYLDGLPDVQRDVPAGSPPMINQTEGQIGLLTLDTNPVLPGYLQNVAVHLDAMVHSPGATPSQRTLSQQLSALLTAAKSDLEQARNDARQLVFLPDRLLLNSANINVLTDLVTHINNAYVGDINVTTGERVGGVSWIYDQLQHLARFDVWTYSS